METAQELLRDLAPLKRAARSDGCLVLVWITNDVKVLRFVLDELLPAWGARLSLIHI